MSVFQSFMDAFRSRTDNSHFHTPTEIVAPEGKPAISLRPLREEDDIEWNTLRYNNRDWLEPWESGDPMHGQGISFSQWVRRERELAEAGSEIVFMVEFEGQIVGQISLGAICYGSMRTGTVGYWIDHNHAGLGFTPLALAMLADWAFGAIDGPRLHRLEIDILPSNNRSKRVVEKLGIPREGLRREYMYINGEWRDHEAYALLLSDVENTVVDRLGDSVTSDQERPERTRSR
ncbi:GNAT family N-acetyltransferase [Bifidobacterium aquikefiri]|uniref:GNAT family N-acetyltransferase n=1 Tax=Bifidobacterium aquikefiri TaxID=1653207 RepID=UPI0039E7F215